MNEKRCILIVDDGPNIRKTLTRILREYGYETETAATGQEALEKAEKHTFCLTFLDLILPDVYGMDLIAPLKEMQPAMPVIVITGHASVGTAVQALNAGASDYVTKPVSVDELLAAVREAIEKQEAEAHEHAMQKALRESEARFRSIFENTTIGLYRTTPNGQILMANPTLVRMLGYSSFEELAQLDLTEAGFEPQYPRSTFQQQIEQKGQVIGLESAWKRRDGTTLFVRESAQAIRDEAGNTLYYEGTVEDVTGRVQAEEELQRLYEQTRQDAEIKATLLQEVHHRVKNNLQIISSLLDLQADRLQAPAALQAFRDSRDRVRAMALVHECLYQAPDLDRLDFGDYVRELAYYLLDVYQGTAVGIRLQVEAEAVSLDLDQAIPCGLILTELMTNAFKHAFPPEEKRAPSQTGTVSVILNTCDGQVQLAVRDDGQGLPEELDPSSTPSLGLGIVKLLTRQLKGKLTVESAAGTGTTFQIVFPLAEGGGSRP